MYLAPFGTQVILSAFTAFFIFDSSTEMTGNITGWERGEQEPGKEHEPGLEPAQNAAAQYVGTH